jgi:hypothetical protein
VVGLPAHDNTAQNLDRSMQVNRRVPPQRLIETMEASVKVPGVVAQLNYLSQLQEMDNQEFKAVELALVGAGIGTENLDTNKLRVLNYKQAMKSEDASEWKKKSRLNSSNSKNTMCSSQYQGSTYLTVRKC